MRVEWHWNPVGINLSASTLRHVGINLLTPGGDAASINLVVAADVLEDGAVI